MYQNYPNPFNPTTSIKFALKTDAMVNLKIYNILGQEVATLVNNEMTAGMKTINFNASNLASGVYIYRLEVLGKDGSKFVNTKKMMLLK
ncbi:MAG TPA: T9SS type A sorting domain-containing protein [Ignavibacteriales bacterium]|nr:T9SS type A sorting domain-containing protein [Ignavibacteriales bacterium]